MPLYRVAYCNVYHTNSKKRDGIRNFIACLRVEFLVPDNIYARVTLRMYLIKRKNVILLLFL